MKIHAKQNKLVRSIPSVLVAAETSLKEKEKSQKSFYRNDIARKRDEILHNK